jgi:tetratricopeptide (TPR) repeat protein
LVIATKEVRHGRFRAYVKKLFGSDSGVQDVMKKLEALTQGEERQVIAETMAGVKKSLSNQERLVEMLAKVDINLQTLSAETREKTATTHRDKLKDILQPSVFPEDAYIGFNKSRTDKTGDWILDDPSFQSWLDGSTRFLWISGNPGTGKSYLASRIISWSQEFFSQADNPDQSSLGYFFFRDSNPETRSVLQALRDMAYQITEDDAYYSKQLLKQLDTGEDIKTLASAFRKLFIEPSTKDGRARKVYLLLDGIDEAKTDELDSLLSLLGLVMDQEEDDTKVQVALIGRTIFSEKVISALDIDVTNEDLRTIYVTPDKNGSDVAAFIAEGVNKSRILRNSTAEFKANIIDVMTKQVDGLFIMAKFMLADLNRRRHSRTILESLQSFPKDINKIILQTLSSLSSTLMEEEAADLNEILRWVTCAEETLTLEQIEAVLTLKYGEPPLQLEETLRGQLACFFTLEREDGLTTADLLEPQTRNRHTTWVLELDAHDADFLDAVTDVEYSSNKASTDVTFFHASIKEFFHSSTSTIVRAEGGGPAVGFDLADARIRILKSCLKIFTDPTYFDIGDKGTSLEQYAAWYWQEHLGQVDIGSTPVVEKKEIGKYLYTMLTEEPVILAWTNMFKESLDLFTDGNLGAIATWMSDPDVLSGLPTAAAVWARQAAKKPVGFIEPMGRLYARAWLADDFEHYIPTLFCFGIVQNMAFMEEGSKWSDAELHWRNVSMKTRIEKAFKWAEHPETAFWHRRVGSTYLVLDMHEEALDHYNQAFRLDRDIVETCGRIAVCYAKSGQFQKALIRHLMCEAIDEEWIAKRSFPSEKEKALSRWRLYRNQLQIAYCYCELGEPDKAIIYYRKAIKNASGNPPFEPEEAYMRLLAEQDYHQGLMGLVEELDSEVDTATGETRLVAFFLSHLAESSVSDWIPRAACRNGKVQRLAQSYQKAITAANRSQDPGKELFLRNSLGILYAFARDYEMSIKIHEEISFVDYRPRGSLIYRLQHTLSFQCLAALYKQKALFATIGSAEFKRWFAKLEKLEELQRKHGKFGMPLYLAGSDINRAAIFLGLLYRLQGERVKALSILSPFVEESFDILEDEEPQNDENAYENLLSTLIAADDKVNGQALCHSMRSNQNEKPYEKNANGDVRDGSGPHENKDQSHLPLLSDSQISQWPCERCLKLLRADEVIMVCMSCVAAYCGPCIDQVRDASSAAANSRSNTTPTNTSTCRANHEWLAIKPLDLKLGRGQVLVDGNVQTLDEWKHGILERWRIWQDLAKR